MTHLHFLKLSSEHLKLSVLNLLGTFICYLKNGPHLFRGLHMQNPVKLINRNTTENSINRFAISVCQSKSSLIPFEFGCCGSYPTIFDGIPHCLINCTKKITCTYFPKSIVTPIKVGRCIKGLRSIHLTRVLGSYKDIEI